MPTPVTALSSISTIGLPPASNGWLKKPRHNGSALSPGLAAVGIVFGLLVAIFFATSSLLIRVGQRQSPDDDGVFMTLFMNVVVMAVVAIFISPPAWDTGAVLALIAGGIVGSLFGRAFNLRAVRLIGPSRSSAFVVGTPVVAAVVGWFVLDEAIEPVEALGGALTIAGLLWLTRARAAPDTVQRTRPSLAGYLIAAAAPVFFGTAFVIRKWGLEFFPSALWAALIGSVAAFGGVATVEAFRGNLTERARNNLRTVNKWFLLAGFTTAAAILSQFTAFTFLPAWVVGIFAGTQGIFAMSMSALFLKGDEHFDIGVIGGIVLSSLGVTLISLHQGLGS